MNKKQREIYSAARRKIFVRFGHGGITKLAELCNVPQPMLSRTLNGKQSNPSLRRKLENDYGIVCVEFTPANPLRSKRPRPALAQSLVQKAA